MTAEVEEVLSDLPSVSRSEKISLINYKDFVYEGSIGSTDAPDILQKIDFKEFWASLKHLKNGDDEVNLIDFGFSDYTHFIKIINEDYLLHLVAPTMMLNPGKVMAVLGLARMKLQELI